MDYSNPSERGQYPDLYYAGQRNKDRLGALLAHERMRQEFIVKTLVEQGFSHDDAVALVWRTCPNQVLDVNTEDSIKGVEEGWDHIRNRSTLSFRKSLDKFRRGDPPRAHKTEASNPRFQYESGKYYVQSKDSRTSVNFRRSFDNMLDALLFASYDNVAQNHAGQYREHLVLENSGKMLAKYDNVYLKTIRCQPELQALSDLCIQIAHLRCIGEDFDPLMAQAVELHKSIVQPSTTLLPGERVSPARFGELSADRSQSIYDDALRYTKALSYVDSKLDTHPSIQAINNFKLLAQRIKSNLASEEHRKLLDNAIAVADELKKDFADGHNKVA